MKTTKMMKMMRSTKRMKRKRRKRTRTCRNGPGMPISQRLNEIQLNNDNDLQRNASRTHQAPSHRSRTQAVTTARPSSAQLSAHHVLRLFSSASLVSSCTSYASCFMLHVPCFMLNIVPVHALHIPPH
ncbi:hypothetical protein BDN70DRAFT_705749 [Pholiota conissans]|uniref:Uncharacterized protein n=1 Tax=Pholiota conissans TaxID=109636 RepID=A0A9P5ZD91_9AGAR|nr:hypothetical protein BDN70DRAFT_705749 [Pholiota conissans]